MRQLVKMKKMENIKKHVCTLPIIEDVLVTYISDGHFVLLRRWWKSYFVIDDKHKYTKACFKSYFIIRREKKYHLRYHYSMIHPFSKAKRHYDIFVAFILLFSILMVNHGTNDTIQSFTNYFIDFILFLDVIRTFITGYYVVGLNVTVFELRKVASHYAKGWLILDLLTVLPENVGQLWMAVTGYDFDIVMVKILEVTRIIKYLRIINEIDKYNKFKKYKFRAFRMLTIITMTIVWISFALYKILENNEHLHDHWYGEAIEHHNFLAIIHRSFFIFFLLNVPGGPPENGSILCMEVMLLQLGYFFYLYSTIQFYQLIHMRNTAINRNELMKSRLYLYANYKNLPDTLRYELMQDFESTFHKSYFNERLIMATVSGQLGQELREFLAEKFQHRFDLFNFMSLEVITSLLHKMTVKTYLENAIISKFGLVNDFIYFLYSGTVAVYSKEGHEICHLHDGSYFGEISFITNKPRTATIIAVEICKIYRLPFKDMKEYAEKYPELFNSIIKTASTRLQESQY